MGTEETFETVLERLEVEREKLHSKLSKIDAAISAVRELAGINTGDQGNNSHPSSIEIRPHAFRGKSISKAAKQYLRMAKMKQTTRQIIDALQSGGIGKKLKGNIVYAVLRREQLVNKDVIRVDSHYWALSEWYNQQ